MDRWFEEAFRRPFSLLRGPFAPARWFSEMEEISPAVDIFEEGDQLVVKVELPGMKKEDLEVSLKDDLLTISGEKQKEKKEEKANYYRMESTHGAFRRSFRLPVEVETNKSKATFTDGILELRMPKSEEAKKREIKIQVH
jgi:HSP20 family protein